MERHAKNVVLGAQERKKNKKGSYDLLAFAELNEIYELIKKNIYS